MGESKTRASQREYKQLPYHFIRTEPIWKFLTKKLKKLPLWVTLSNTSTLASPKREIDWEWFSHLVASLGVELH